MWRLDVADSSKSTSFHSDYLIASYRDLIYYLWARLCEKNVNVQRTKKKPKPMLPFPSEDGNKNTSLSEVILDVIHSTNNLLLFHPSVASIFLSRHFMDLAGKLKPDNRRSDWLTQSPTRVSCQYVQHY